VTSIRASIVLAGALVAVLACARIADARDELLQWDEAPPLPDAHGLAGPFAGVSNDVLLVAGGANFPQGRPWGGHPKAWHDRIFALPEMNGRWVELDTTLPHPVAYGLSVAWDDAVICIGGADAATCSRECFALRWTGGDVSLEMLPPLPEPLAFSAGALLGEVVYVVGGLNAPDATTCSARFLALDLARPANERRWQTLDPWPGPERCLAVAGVQAGSLYVFGGLQLMADADGQPMRVRPFLADAYRFTPRRGSVDGQWSRLAGMPHPRAAAPSPAVTLGPAHLLVLGGDDGTIIEPIALRDAHPGFASAILMYHTVTDTWTTSGHLPRDPGPDPAGDPDAGIWPPVTTVATWWNDRLVVPSGEVRPGVRTRRVLVAELQAATTRFGWIDASVVADFFLGGRRVVWWAAGLSIFGTQLSAITFLAIPAKAYATDWLYFVQNMGIIAIAPLIVWLYLPIFRRLCVTTAYEYLEQRFNVALRLFGSVSFVLYQLARMGIVMFLPALALAAVTGQSIATCILIMGILCTLYTVLGGIEAVIWTDVLQVLVLLGGAVLALVILVAGTDGGLGGAYEAASAARKLRLVDVSWDWTGPALGVILLGAVFNNLVPYTSDQAVVQRYLTTRSEVRAVRSVWAAALLTVPASVVFFAVGTALYTFYRSHPDRMNPLGPTDQVFAWFIANELPVGVAGLVIAGVFAAAMSSLDSSMNSIAAVITTDFYRRFAPHRAERRYLALARGTTVLLGAAGTGAALLQARFQVASLLDQFLVYLGLLGGTMAGLFALGILSSRATTRGALVGVAAAVAALVYVKTSTPLNGLAYSAVGMVTCFVIGLVASVLLPGPPPRVAGLTIHSPPPRADGVGDEQQRDVASC
jgi:SSS family transporter